MFLPTGFFLILLKYQSILGKGILRMILFTATSVHYCDAPEARYIFNEVFGPKVNSALFQQELKGAQA